MIASLGGQDHDERMQEVYSSFFHPRSDRVVASRAVQEAVQTPAAVAVAEVRSLWVDTQDIAREVEQPVLWIRSGPVPTAQVEAVETCFQNGAYAQTVGVGHFPQLEDPDQVNAMIARFLKNL